MLFSRIVLCTFAFVFLVAYYKNSKLYIIQNKIL